MLDRELFTAEERKALIERYPYLQPRRLVDDSIPSDYNFSYIRGEHELPPGWIKFFLQACEDIREPLRLAGQLESFRFSQIKEKYGSMRLYTFGAPAEVHEILDRYEFLSEQICCECGKPAIGLTKGWIYPYCSEHMEQALGNTGQNYDKIELVAGFTRRTSSAAGITKKYIDCSDIWTRYLERLKHND